MTSFLSPERHTSGEWLVDRPLRLVVAGGYRAGGGAVQSASKESLKPPVHAQINPTALPGLDVCFRIAKVNVQSRSARLYSEPVADVGGLAVSVR